MVRHQIGWPVQAAVLRLLAWASCAAQMCGQLESISQHRAAWLIGRQRSIQIQTAALHVGHQRTIQTCSVGKRWFELGRKTHQSSLRLRLHVSRLGHKNDPQSWTCTDGHWETLQSVAAGDQAAVVGEHGGHQRMILPSAANVGRQGSSLTAAWANAAEACCLKMADLHKPMWGH